MSPSGAEPSSDPGDGLGWPGWRLAAVGVIGLVLGVGAFLVPAEAGDVALAEGLTTERAAAVGAAFLARWAPDYELGGGYACWTEAYSGYRLDIPVRSDDQLLAHRLEFLAERELSAHSIELPVEGPHAGATAAVYIDLVYGRLVGFSDFPVEAPDGAAAFVEAVLGDGYEPEAWPDDTRSLADEQYFTYRFGAAGLREGVYVSVSERAPVVLDAAVRYIEFPDPLLADSGSTLWISNLSVALAALLALVATVLFVRRALRRRVQWVLPLGLAAVALASGLFSSWVESGDVWLAWWFVALYSWSAFVILAVALGERGEGRSPLRLGRVGRVLGLGVLLAGVDLGLLTAFYLVAWLLGGWMAPLQGGCEALVPSSGLLVVWVLTVGLWPAITEECLFRRLFLSLVASWPVAVQAAVMSLVWSFGHVSYLTVPWWLRIAEFMAVTGPFFFIVYRRYGLGVAMVTHYLVDALILGLAVVTLRG